jgi:hypothetical protein
MGRPSSCHTCCGGGPGGLPPISDCANLLCIVFMSRKAFMRDDHLQAFIDLWPDRVFILLDVEANNQTQTIVLSTLFENTARLLTLSTEYADDPTNLIPLIIQDNGSLATAITNDPWPRVKEILSRNSLYTTWFTTNCSEYSIVVDPAGGMTEFGVSATVQNLEDEIDALGLGHTRVESIPMASDKIFCPFVTSECCDGSATTALATLCQNNPDEGNYDWSCPEFESINFLYPYNNPDPALGLDYNTYEGGFGLGYGSGPYSPGDSLLLEVGDSGKLQSPNNVGCLPGYHSIYYGQWKTRTPAGSANPFISRGSASSHLVGLVVPSGGIDVYPELGCVYI